MKEPFWKKKHNLNPGQNQVCPAKILKLKLKRKPKNES